MRNDQDSLNAADPALNADHHSSEFWRRASKGCFIFSLVVALVQTDSLIGTQQTALVLGVLIMIAAGFFRHGSLPDACEILSENRGLLVPVGFVLAAQAVFGLLTRLPGLRELLTDGANFHLLGISVALSLATAYSIVIWTAFASWQTDLLWRAAHGEEQPSLAPGPPIRRHFLRVLAVLAVGVVVMLIALIPALAVSAMVMIFGLLLIGVLGVAWNLLTVVLLPVTMYTEAPLTESIREGFLTSWELRNRWMIPVLVHMLLLGGVAFTYGRRHEEVRIEDPRTRSVRIETRDSTTSGFQVNAFWTGAYENNSRWYSYYLSQTNTQGVPVVSLLLKYQLLILAVTLKLTVIRELVSARAEPEETVAPDLE